MAFALVGSISAGSITNDNVTTAGLDTTGATLLVAAVASGNGTRTLADSLTNTWIALTRRTQSASGDSIQLFYARPTTAQVGVGQTFTVTSTAQFPAVAVAAYSGRISSALQSDADVGNANTGSYTAVGPGEATPVDSNELIVCAVEQNAATAGNAITPAAFTIRETFTATANAFGLVLADSIQTTPVSVAPRFSWTTAVTYAAAMSEWHVTPGTTSDDGTATISDAWSAKRRFLQNWFATNNPDVNVLLQRWVEDDDATTPAGFADVANRMTLLERAMRGKTS